MPEINRNGGDAQPGADNCVIDGHSQSAHSAALHTPDAGIWTSEALSAPTSRHLRGEAWPREHMHVEYERSGTERAGVQVADDQPSSALRYSLLPFSVIAVGGVLSHQSHVETILILYGDVDCLLVVLGDLG